MHTDICACVEHSFNHWHCQAIPYMISLKKCYINRQFNTTKATHTPFRLVSSVNWYKYRQSCQRSESEPMLNLRKDWLNRMRQVCSKTMINMIKQFELDREKLLDMKILLVSTDPPTYLTLEHSRFENRFFLYKRNFSRERDCWWSFE